MTDEYDEVEDVSFRRLAVFNSHESAYAYVQSSLMFIPEFTNPEDQDGAAAQRKAIATWQIFRPGSLLFGWETWRIEVEEDAAVNPAPLPEIEPKNRVVNIVMKDDGPDSPVSPGADMFTQDGVAYELFPYGHPHVGVYVGALKGKWRLPYRGVGTGSRWASDLYFPELP